MDQKMIRKENTKMRPSSPVALIGVPVVALLMFAVYSAMLSRHVYSENPQPAGFWTNEVKFYDDSTGTKKLLPNIPKQWHLLAVSKGERENEEVLWFRDKGAIYRVSGFFDKDVAHFTMNHTINKIASE
jgi:hypothetical protein